MVKKAIWYDELPASNYPFKGWDWSELGEAWAIEVNPPEGLNEDEEGDWIVEQQDDLLAKEIGNYLLDAVFFDEIRNPQALADTRAFLQKVAAANRINAPVIKGILRIKHPWTFTHWVARNLQTFWT